jgi:hypothetical protein
MKTYAYISRHALTGEQLELINAANITVATIGDMDGFSITKDSVDDSVGFEVDGVIVVHAGAVARLMKEEHNSHQQPRLLMTVMFFF